MKWNWKRILWVLFFCFWHFLSKSFAKLYFDVTEWKYPRGLFEYPYDNLTFFLLIPLWHEICTISFILCNGKKQEKNLRISFFVYRLKKSQAEKFLFFWCHLFKINQNVKILLSVIQILIDCFTLTWQEKDAFKFWPFFR